MFGGGESLYLYYKTIIWKLSIGMHKFQTPTHSSRANFTTVSNRYLVKTINYSFPLVLLNGTVAAHRWSESLVDEINPVELYRETFTGPAIRQQAPPQRTLKCSNYWPTPFNRSCVARVNNVSASFVVNNRWGTRLITDVTITGFLLLTSYRTSYAASTCCRSTTPARQFRRTTYFHSRRIHTCISQWADT